MWNVCNSLWLSKSSANSQNYCMDFKISVAILIWFQISYETLLISWDFTSKNWPYLQILWLYTNKNNNYHSLKLPIYYTDKDNYIATLYTATFLIPVVHECVCVHRPLLSHDTDHVRILDCCVELEFAWSTIRHM